MILDGTSILNIVRLPNETFGEHTGDVKVDTMILILGLGSSSGDLTKVVAYGGYNRITEINPTLADSYQIVDQSDWLKFDDHRFSFNLSDKNQLILGKCRKNTKLLGNCADFSLGLTPYDKYRGHTEEQIKNQVYHASCQKNSTFKPLLLGNDVRNYNVVWNGKTWISYGEWLGAPREKRFFTERRILVKQIIDWSSKKIWAAITEQELYNTQNAFVIIPHEEFFHEYLLAIINSRLMSFYHKKMFVDEYKARFQKILIKECRLFPIKIIDKKAQNPFKIEVNRILDAKRRDDTVDTSLMEARIDNMIYDLYELTVDEVEIIENN